VVWWRSSSAWGAPEVHEDDAERAVRAGLAIAAAAETEVRVSPVSDLGQGMVVGDVMNTASRLQPVAPVGRVDAGEATFRATRAVSKPDAVGVWFGGGGAGRRKDSQPGAAGAVPGSRPRAAAVAA
jgi:class 3 adenylate cyclase